MATFSLKTFRLFFWDPSSSGFLQKKNISLIGRPDMVANQSPIFSRETTWTHVLSPDYDLRKNLL